MASAAGRTPSRGRRVPARHPQELQFQGLQKETLALAEQLVGQAAPPGSTTHRPLCHASVRGSTSLEASWASLASLASLASSAVAWPLLRAPEGSSSILEARRGRRSPPPAATKLRNLRARADQVDRLKGLENMANQFADAEMRTVERANTLKSKHNNKGGFARRRSPPDLRPTSARPPSRSRPRSPSSPRLISLDLRAASRGRARPKKARRPRRASSAAASPRPAAAP